jgi:hypothetical protein
VGLLFQAIRQPEAYRPQAEQRIASHVLTFFHFAFPLLNEKGCPI